MSQPDSPEGASQGSRPPEWAAEFASFYRDHFKLLIAYLIYQGCPVHLAAEFAQDAMIALYERWEKIDHPKAYTYKAAYRAFIRHAMKVHQTPVEDAPEPSGLLPRPEDADAWLQEQEIVLVLRELPPRQRQILALHLDGWSNQEIAELLKMEESAVGSNLKKARLNAAEHLRRLREERP